MDIDRVSTRDRRLAPQSCVACRQKKRKCDKVLPCCSLCQRVGRSCEYSANASIIRFTDDDFLAVREEVTQLKNLVASSAGNLSKYGLTPEAENPELPAGVLTPSTDPPSPTGTKSSFPSLYFLDSYLFEYEKQQVTAPYIRIPSSSLSHLDSSAQLRTMVEVYFDSVHSYFPIISKIRLFQILANPSLDPGADLALLFLVIKLVTLEDAGVRPGNHLYQNAKSSLQHVESLNGFTIHYFQALLLISLYEVGHCIYPAAYLSIGHAARVGFAMGLHQPSAPQMLPPCQTWTEQEERRRLWWAVIVLDRFVNIGHDQKPFAVSDPELSTHLPVDDASWDRGQMLVAAPLALSASSTAKAGTFARICQAAHLLSKVIRHIDDKTIPPDSRYTEALQLNRTLHALCAIITCELDERTKQGLALCSAAAICYSALLKLFDAYSCTEQARNSGINAGSDGQLVLQEQSIEGIHKISELVLELARRIVEGVRQEGTMDRVSPFVIESLYAGAANYAWGVRETSDQIYANRLREMKDVLRALRQKWGSAREYLHIIETRELQFASGVK